MAVSAVNNPAASGAPATAAANAASAQSLQDQFLNLLVVQLNNQDPLNPMDNAQITSQLAQISTVQGVTDLKKVVASISGQIDVSQSMAAVSMLGKKVLVPGHSLKLDTDATGARVGTPVGVDLQGEAASVTVAITDSAGRVVRTLDMGPQDAGILNPQWDGKDDSGNPMPDGAYTISVIARDAGGAAVTAEALTYGQVHNVAYTTNGVRLDLGLTGQYSILDIRKVIG